MLTIILVLIFLPVFLRKDSGIMDIFIKDDCIFSKENKEIKKLISSSSNQLLVRA